MNDDFYCNQILSGTLQVDQVIETENVLAFHHTRPAYPVHIVVIPKKHIESFATWNFQEAALVGEMLDVLQKVSARVLAEHGACRVITNLGAYQESKHLHWHIVSGERIQAPGYINPV